MSDPHRHCWHAMDGSTTEEHFYACCFGGCGDVMAAGRREFEDKSHGIIGWQPGRVHRPAGCSDDFPALRAEITAEARRALGDRGSLHRFIAAIVRTVRDFPLTHDVSIVARVKGRDEKDR